MATSKLVSELVINQLTAAQYWQAKENGEIKADELYLIIPEKPKAQTVDAYTKAESDERYQPKIEAVGFGFGFLPGRRPGATITTDTQGITFDRPIYVMGDSVATKADLAQLRRGVPRGTWLAPSGRASWIVPDGVRVVKITWSLGTTFFKVNPGAVFRTEIRVTVDSPELWSWTLNSATCSPNSDADFASIYDLLSRHGTRDTATSEFDISWSPEINAHAVDVDLTK